LSSVENACCGRLTAGNIVEKPPLSRKHVMRGQPG
jgi:hypothetical protein